MSVTLPYFSDASTLSGPLPTQQEIETATNTLPTIQHLEYDGRIVLIREQSVVKYGRYVPENEGQVLLFIERNLSIPAPRLYAMYRKEEKAYLIMQYVPGTDLDTLWSSLSNLDKQSILDQLQSMFDEMRSVTPRDFFGSVAGGPVPYRYFLTQTKDPAINGPFQTEKDFNLAGREVSPKLGIQQETSLDCKVPRSQSPRRSQRS